MHQLGFVEVREEARGALKRGRLAGALAVLSALAAAPLIFHAFWSMPRRLTVREADIAVPGLPAALSGLRLALVSDIHAGAPMVGEDDVRRIVERLNALKPDAVLFLGDFTYHGLFGRPLAASKLAAALSGVAMPAFAVFGNHDWWFHEAAALRTAFNEQGILVLENAASPLRTRGAVVWFAGLADLITETSDIKGALAGVPRGAAVVVLSHQPDVFPEIPDSVSLTVAGHTHGGQIVLPWFGAPYVPSRFWWRRYVGGYYEEGGRRLFVTTGIGTSIVPARLGVTPEIAVLTLRRR